MARTTTALLAFAAIAGVAIAADDSNIGSRHAVDVKKAAEEMRSVDESIGSGKLYFTGTGYTVNLIPHTIVLGLLALGEPPPPPVLLLLPLLLLLLISNDVISLSESRGGKTIALATGATSGTERKTFHSPFPIAPRVNNVNNVVVSLFDISTLLLGECRQPLSEN